MKEVVGQWLLRVGMGGQPRLTLKASSPRAPLLSLMWATHPLHTLAISPLLPLTSSACDQPRRFRFI